MTVLRILTLGFIFAATSMAWLILGGVTASRTTDQTRALGDAIAELWGSPIDQEAPSLAFRHVVQVTKTETWTDAAGAPHDRQVTVAEIRHDPVIPASTRVEAAMSQDVRRKGLVWYPLYDLRFAGTWRYVHERDEAGDLVLSWPFPDPSGFYDDLVVTVDGVPQRDVLGQGQVELTVPVQPGAAVEIGLAFRTRGNERWTYQPARGVGELRDFSLRLTTDFTDVDFPGGTLSPTTREAAGDGEVLTWTFSRMVSGKGIGMVVPCPIQPGELAASMAFSAPFSLGLFMVWIYVLGLLKGIDVHPMNHAFLAAAFFAFHLLFGYTADRLPVEAAFALSAVVSVVLVVTYLMRVVSPRFAVVEAGLAQLVYLVGFALAHFWDGATGLTLTVIGILTLFALMQLTSHVRWAELFAGEPARAG